MADLQILHFSQVALGYRPHMKSKVAEITETRVCPAKDSICQDCAGEG